MDYDFLLDDPFIQKLVDQGHTLPCDWALQKKQQLDALISICDRRHRCSKLPNCTEEFLYACASKREANLDDLPPLCCWPTSLDAPTDIAQDGYGQVCGLDKMRSRIVDLYNGISVQNRKLIEFLHNEEDWKVKLQNACTFLSSPELGICNMVQGINVERANSWILYHLRQRTNLLRTLNANVQEIEGVVKEIVSRRRFHDVELFDLVNDDVLVHIFNTFDQNAACAMQQVNKHFRNHALLLEQMPGPRIRKVIAIANCAGTAAGPFPHARYPNACGIPTAYVCSGLNCCVFVDLTAKCFMRAHPACVDTAPIWPKNKGVYNRGKKWPIFGARESKDEAVPYFDRLSHDHFSEKKLAYSLELVFADSFAVVVLPNGEKSLRPISENLIQGSFSSPDVDDLVEQFTFDEEQEENFRLECDTTPLPAICEFRVKALSSNQLNRNQKFRLRVTAWGISRGQPFQLQRFSEPFLSVSKLQVAAKQSAQKRTR